MKNKEKKKEYQKQYYLDNKERVLEQQKQYNLDNKERKKQYDKQYRLDNKEERKAYKKQYYLDNKEQIKQYRLDNKEKISEKEKQYYQNNKEKYNAYTKQYYLDNKEQISEQKKPYRKQYYQNNKERVSQYKKERYHSDPLFKFKLNCRSRTYQAFKQKSWRKNGSTEKLLGCDWKTAMNHIESQFEPWMNWDNHGEWEIDHIIPLASANTKEEMSPLFNYKNLQPLLAEDNMRKGDRIL